MMIIDGYGGCSEQDILEMPAANLRKAVIRMFSLHSRPFAEGDSWHGEFFTPDEIADAFRGRT